MQQLNFSEMSGLLRETELQHAKVEKDLPSSHEWQDWYGAYLATRMEGEYATQEDAAVIASAYVLTKWADRLNPASSATKDGVTIIDGTQTEVCDECGADVPTTGNLISPCHEVSCSLHPGNVQAGYTTLQGLTGIAGVVLVILALIVLATPAPDLGRFVSRFRSSPCNTLSCPNIGSHDQAQTFDCR